MSTNYTRDSQTDTYAVLTSYNNYTQSQQEQNIAQALVESNFQASLFPNPSGVYTDPVTDLSWNYFDLSSGYINSSAISNYPAGTLTEYSVISSKLHQPDVSLNSYQTNISSSSCNNNIYTFKNLTSSAPYYDSNYVVTQSLLADCSDNQSGTFVNGTFDLSNSNVKIQYAMQSRWNTTVDFSNGLASVGPDPTAIIQDVSFNTLQAFAQKGSSFNSTTSQVTDLSYESYWFSVGADGSLLSTIVDASYQPIPNSNNTNNLMVLNRDMTGVTLDVNKDVGVFRIQQTDNAISTLVQFDNGFFVDISTNETDYLQNMPMFNGYGQNPSGDLVYNSSKTSSSMYVPGTMNQPQFQTLFDTDVLNTIANGWTFDISINNVTGSGYNIAEPHPLVSNLDNSNLLDNLYYMQNYVTNTHSLNISNTLPLEIVDFSNGQQSVIDAIIIDLSNGETLTSTYAGVNGEIILNTNSDTTRTTDTTTSSDFSSNIIPYVYYLQDNSSNYISGQQTTQPYFEALWQKVAQESGATSSDYYFKKNDNALMTLYTNEIVDNLYEQSDFSFNFYSSTFGSSGDIRLWKINATNNVIINPQSLYSDASYSDLITGIATSGALTNLTTDLSFNEYRVLLTAKVISDIDLSNAVAGAGWELTYINGDSYLKTSSTQAFSELGMPIYDPSFVQYLVDGSSVPFSYTYGTEENAANPGGLVDYVDISYNYNGTIVVRIPQTEITRTYNSGSDVSYNKITDTSYNFTGTIYNKTSWELVYVTSHSSYNATFNPNFGPFSNLQMTINNITQQDNYYAIRFLDASNNFSFAPQSALQYVNAFGVPNFTNKTIETISRTGGLSISGTFKANDLKPFKSYAQGGNKDTNTWTNITTLNQSDVYYGINNNYTIDTSSVSLNQGELVTNFEYTPFSNSTNTSIILNLTSQHYYVPFTYDLSGAFNILTSFEANTTDLSSNTNIGKTSMSDTNSYLTLTNGYSNVNETSWVSTNYNLSVNQTGSKTTFTVTDLSHNTIFTIVSLNNTVFLGDYIVTYIPTDYYRTDRLLGSVSSPVFSEQFIRTTYPVAPNGHNQVILGASGQILAGLSIGTNNSVNLSAENVTLGSWQQFRVRGDYMTINEVGLASTTPSSSQELGISGYNSGGLNFTYVSGNSHSATFKFGLYRGYYSYNNTSTNQYYTISRGITESTFEVSGGSLSNITQTLTSNMFYNESFVVNDLKNTSNQLVANLGVSGEFSYSIPPTNSPGSSYYNSYPVSVTGDSVKVTITNPNYTSSDPVVVDPSATPVNNPKSYTDTMTLINYGRDNMYTFSGLWYLDNRLMAIRPSRVRMNNAYFPYNNFDYRISSGSQSTTLYKAINNSDISYNWIGNPQLHDTQDPNSLPSSNYWVRIDSKNFNAMISEGFTIGRKIIRQDPLLSNSTKLAYIVSAPPYYTFNQISTASCATIPYNYNTDFSSNRTTRYMPYINFTNGNSNSTFNPFAAVNTYTDINNNTTSVDSSGAILNNIRFTLLQTPPSLTNALMSPNSTRYGIIVQGTNLAVNFYSGLYNSTQNYGHYTNPIWNGPVTSIPSTPNINNNALIFRGRDASGGITFSALQYPADIGYPSGSQGYIDVLNTTNSYNWYNIDFNMGNSAWFNNNSPVTYFDINASGIESTLFTVVDVNDPITQLNKRRVYKYTSLQNIDIDASGGVISNLQTFNLTYDTRYYYDFDISMNNTFNQSSGIWNYNNLLDNTRIPNSSINWILDSSFNGTTAYVSWAFGNQTTSTNMLVDLFSVQDTQQKWVYINLKPFQRCLNQFNLQVGSVAWDGSVTAPLVSTRVIQLAPSINIPVLNTSNTFTTQQYSESTL